MALFQKKFEAHSIEQDIERLSRQIEEKKQKLHEMEDAPEDKEVLREVVGERISEAPAATAISDDDAAPDHDESRELPEYLDDAEPGIRKEVHTLVHLAMREGIEKAATEAKRHDSFVLDAFHDALVDTLYEELKRREVISD